LNRYFPLDVGVAGSGDVAVASDDRTPFDRPAARSGAWMKTPIAAGVGSDGKVLPSSPEDNEVIAMQAGRELWRQSSLPRRSPPFVAGERVFILAADRSVNADGQTGEL
jgi:hypothetical protein